MALLVQDKSVGVSRDHNASVAKLLGAANCLLIAVQSRLEEGMRCTIISLPKRHSSTALASWGSHRLRIVNVWEIASLRVIRVAIFAHLTLRHRDWVISSQRIIRVGYLREVLPPKSSGVAPT